MIANNGNKIISDRCIWCGEKDDLSESHLIPVCLGGRFRPRITCKKCNNYLGTAYESTAVKNAFLSAARVVTGLASRCEAYRFGRKYDEQTGLRLVFTKNDKVAPVLKRNGNSIYTGPHDDVVGAVLSWFSKERPNWPIEPLVEFLNDPRRSEFRYVGELYKKIQKKGQAGKVSITQEQELNAKLVFKVFYEFAAVKGLLRFPTIRRFLQGFVTVNSEVTKDRIVISNDVRKYIFSNISNTFGAFKDLEEIPFKEYHYFVIRLSRDLVLYLEFVLFGQIRCFIIIGNWIDEFANLSQLLDLCHGYDLRGRVLPPERYHNIEFKDHLIWVDAAIKARIWYNTAGGRDICPGL